MMNLKPTVYAFTLMSALVACNQENEVIRPDSGTEPAIESAANMAAEAERRAELESTASSTPTTGGTSDTATETNSGFIAELQPIGSNAVRGTVMFSDTGVSVTVNANVEGLVPMTAHGFHIHEFGDCSAPDASSAGEHYDPEGQRHGAPDSVQRHIGDLGNLISNDAGIAQLRMVDMKLSFSGEHSILGRAVVLHASADDMESQPSGDSGDPIACGVIQIVN